MNKCILCGAGAEAKFGLSQGINFAEAVLGINQPEMNCALKKFYGGHEYLWCGKREKMTDFELDDLFEAAVRRSYISGEETAESISKIDDIIKEQKDTWTEDKKRELISCRTSYMGIIDEHFHTLINPKVLGPVKFWRVVDCYTRAYLLLVSQLLYQRNDLKCDDYVGILEKPQETQESLQEIIENDERFRQPSYYSIIKGYNNTYVITTNYTPCCEIITGQREKVAYVHGKIGLFEVPYEWKVYDAAHIEQVLKDNKQVFFPYLFIQSGVKPIVEKIQIEEYCKMLNAFTESERIIILGYGLNCDDNHINGLLRDAFYSGKEIVYFDFSDRGDWKESSDSIAKKLRIDMPDERIRVVRIDPSNCLTSFERELAN